jgi:DNA-binding transcriptional MerR regulator
MSDPMSIGEVADLLKDEFPSVTVSKLRFLESEGLMRPARGSSGYREYDDADIERARYILRMQRDHFLPLKVIRSKLSALEQGREPTTTPPAGPPPETYFGSADVQMDAEELARSAGVSLGLIEALLSHGVLEPEQGDDGPVFDEDSLVVARAAQRLIGHGLEARHLRTMRLGANREVDLMRQLTGPLLRHPSPANRQQAAEVLADCAQAVRELQEAIVRSDLRNLLDR